MTNRRRNAVAAMVLAVCFRGAFAQHGDRITLDIGPGPKVMSEEEKAIVPDPSKGIRHGVVLLRESERSDYDWREGGGIADKSRWSYHMRAKILSAEGRGLADVEIPLSRNDAVLLDWWGRTILPDGTVHELKEKDLVEETSWEKQGREWKRLKGALPGVVPGAILDFGYVFEWRYVTGQERFPIQLVWPVLRFRLHWIPAEDWMSAYEIERTEGLDVTVKKEARSVMIEGRNLPAIPIEPFMPPVEESGALFTVSATLKALDRTGFWGSEARKLDREAREFATDEKLIEGTIGSMALPPDAGPMARLRAAYDWIQSRIRNLDAGSSFELPYDRSEEKRDRTTARMVLDKREARAYEIDLLFLAVARALGFEAHLAFATDRRDRYWSESELSLRQADWAVVAIREAGKPESPETFADAGSGLPFGQIPWWLTGARGFLVSPEKPGTVLLRPAEARRSILETKGRIAFDGETGAGSAEWSLSAMGQQKHRESWSLAGLVEADRPKRLVEICAGEAHADVVKAERPAAPGVEGFRVDCAADLPLSAPIDSVDPEFPVKLDGPWLEPVPVLAAGERLHPVIFPFPKTDILSLDVASPRGFGPGPAPRPVMRDSPFGRYMLSITATPEGYHVERVFSLGVLGVPSSEYASLQSFLAEARHTDAAPLIFVKAGGEP